MIFKGVHRGVEVRMEKKLYPGKVARVPLVPNKTHGLLRSGPRLAGVHKLLPLDEQHVPAARKPARVLRPRRVTRFPFTETAVAVEATNLQIKQKLLTKIRLRKSFSAFIK